MIKTIKEGDFLSENSHYLVENVGPNTTTLLHFESRTNVQVSNEYISDLMFSAGENLEEVKVTKEDKHDGTLGIRSIFENISGGEVFTVCFEKQAKAKSKRALDAEIKKRVEDFSEAIEKAKTQKKGVAKVAQEYAENLIKNPVLPLEPGEDRILRGYKVQFTSRDGRYQCMDMDITEQRPVNINTIKWLIYKGVKYVVAG